MSFSVRVGLPNSPLRLALLLSDHDFCDIGKPDIFRDLQRYILAVRHNDLGAEPLRELYVLRKPGLILIIYDRIRLHIDGGKST